jgi:hypothetical protein
MKKLIYLCGNDGTDTRVSKEIKSLSKKYSILFIGVKSEKPFRHSKIDHKLFLGSHKNFITILLMNLYLLRILFSKQKFDRLHIINEQLYVFFMPILLFFNIHITLDVFDSFFLKHNIDKNKYILLKRLIYGSVDRVIVTDENRFNLLPDFVKPKSIIIPNVPFRSNLYSNPKPKRANKLVIAYFGTLKRDRGSEFIESLLFMKFDITILMAGWIADSFTENLIVKYPDSIKYFGVITQENANKLIYEKSDYLLCIYPANNINNIFASPNKIYDAMHTKTPVIMNSEIMTSKFVEENNLGLIIDSMNSDPAQIYNELNHNRGKYNLTNEMASSHIWENYEEKLYK